MVRTCLVAGFAVLAASPLALAGEPDGPMTDAPEQPQRSPGLASGDARSAVGSVITLPEVFRRAETGSMELSVLREKLSQAEAQLSKAWSVVLPHLQGIGSYTHNSVAAEIPFPDFGAGFGPAPGQPDTDRRVYPLEMIPIEVQPQNQWVGRLEATVPLLIMPAYFGLGAARRAVDASQSSVAHARNELFFAIARVYYGAVATSRVVELARRQVDGATESERVARGRYEAGELSRVGFLRAGVERARAEQDLRRAQNADTTTRLALATVVGIEEPFSVVAPAAVEPPGGKEKHLLEIALEEREDLAAAERSTEIADDSLKAAWWKYAPIVAVKGNYTWMNFAGFSGSNDVWAVSVNAVWNLYDGGLREAELTEAKSHLREAQALLTKRKRVVAQDVKSATLELESARANLIKATEQNRLAEESARLVDEQFKAGAATYLDIVDANNARFAAGVAVVSEELNVQVASLKLAKAVGRFGVERLEGLDPPR